MEQLNPAQISLILIISGHLCAALRSKHRIVDAYQTGAPPPTAGEAEQVPDESVKAQLAASHHAQLPLLKAVDALLPTRCSAIACSTSHLP
jgi:hypothetical protein